MIHTVIDLINLYLSMLIQHILRLPYVLRVISGVVILFLILYLCMFCIIKKLAIPLLNFLLRMAICLLQMMIYAVGTLIPAFWETGVAQDEVLNNLGIKLDRKCKKNKEKVPENEKMNKIFPYAFWITLAVSLVFLVIPYYMEPMMSDNAKEICAKVNEVSENFQEGIRRYADKHYHLDEPDSKKAEDGRNTITEEQEEKYVLHLNKNGYQGANLRKSPKMKKNNIITAISGDIELYYENKIVDDGKRVWVKVSTKDTPKAWISKKLIKKKDLKAAGIK